MPGRALFVCVLLTRLIVFSFCFTNDAGDCSTPKPHLDVFHMFLAHFNRTSSEVITDHQLEEAIASIIEHIDCNVTTTTGVCEKAICFDYDSLFNQTVSNISHGITEAEFALMSPVLLVHLLNIEQFCRTNIQFNFTENHYRQELIKTITGNSSSVNINAEDLQSVLEKFAVFNSYSPENSEDHTAEGDDHPDEDHHLTDDEGEGHETQAETDEHAHAHRSVNQEQCLSAGLVFDSLGSNPENPISVEELDQVSGVILYQLFEGSEVKDECRLLPRRYYFLDELFQHQTTLTESQFASIVKATLEVEQPVNDDGHGHRRRRREANDEHDHDEEEWAKCYSSEELLAIHNVEEDSAITRNQFTEICPSLLQVKLSGKCAEHTETSQLSSVSDLERYGYGTIAVVIICLCSLIGVAAIPLAKKRVFEIILDLFRGLAIGTLVADPLLHLVPQALGLHGHSEDAHAHDESSGIVVEEFIGFSLVVLGGIYAFYLTELAMTLSGLSHTHAEDSLTVRNQEPQTMNGFDNEAFSSKAEMYEIQPAPGHEVQQQETDKKRKGLNVVAVMIIVGDGIHNFVDGLAIGAAFSQSTASGIATSITVFCHEFPHEFGDFAVLVSNGLTVWRALCWNLLSALTAIIGLYVGLAVSTDPMTSRWIFSFTAGLFLYIALVNLIPDVIRRSTSGKHNTATILVSNLGMFIGAGIMLCLAIFEEKIVIET